MRGAARFLLLGGALALGFFFVRVAPRDVTLVYDVGASGPRRIEVEIDRAGETVRRAELRLPPGAPQAAHRVRLTDGDYRVRLALRSPGGTRRLERELTVTESGTTVLPLADVGPAQRVDNPPPGP